MRRPLGIGTILIALLIATRAVAQTAPSPAAQLRTYFFQRDYEGGYRAGLTIVNPAASPETRAWFVANEARYGLEDEALAGVDSIPRGSPWRDFARVVALCEAGQCDSAAPLARALAARRPLRADFVWAGAYASINRGRMDEAVAALERAHRLGMPATAELLAIEGSALMTRASRDTADTVDRRRAHGVFAEARALDSTNVDAHYFEGASAGAGPVDSEMIARLGRAATLAPFATAVHFAYWSALLSSRKGADTATRAAIIRDIANVLQGRGDDPGGLSLASEGYKLLDSVARRREMRDRIVRDYPASLEADRVLRERIYEPDDSSVRGMLADTGAVAREHRARLVAFIARPVHHERSMLGSVYVNLFLNETGDTTVPSDTLLATIRNMVRSDHFNPRITHVIAPVALADRHIALPYAEKLARDAEPLLRNHYADLLPYLKPRQVAQDLSSALAEQRDALGWVYVNEGRFDVAERLLAEARALNRMSALVYYHLGRLAEVQGEMDSAEARYAQGYRLETGRRFAGTKSSDALRRLYVATHGSTDGFDAFADTLREQDRKRRHVAIEKSRLTSGAVVRPFRLALIGGGGPVASDSLRHKIVVIHFWGTWCGPCVEEMPDFERWYETVRADTAIVVVGIDFLDTDRDAVKRFAAGQHLEFPILADDGYVEKAGVHEFPTTWFVDRTGRLAFVANGFDGVLAEEFGWRVDMLRR